MRARIAYALAALIFGVSLIGYTATGLTVGQIYERLEEISGVVRAMPRAPIPGEADVHLPDPGEYTIFFEAPAGQTGNDPPELRIEVSAEDGGPVQTRSAVTKVSYELELSGVSVRTFQITRPGVYRVVAAYPEGSGESPAVLAFGMGLDRRINDALVPGIWWLVWFAGIAVATTIAALTYFRQPDPLPSRATRP